MISSNVVNSAKFLKMPSETQALYFHLCIHADDDWVCEAFTVMRQTWSSEDNIRVLQAKEFIKILNEDLVTYIMDRNEHNLLRADRKINSIYKELLLQIIPDVELIEPKQRADRRAKKPLKNMWLWYSGTSHGQPMDDVGEGSIVEVRKEKNNNFSDDFNYFWQNFPHARSWNKKESFTAYRDSAIDKMVIMHESKLLTLEIEYWVIDWKYVKACQWWLKNLVHSKKIFGCRIVKVCEKMIEQWVPAEKKRELRDIFTDYDIAQMFAEIRDRKKNLLIDSIKNEK